MKNSIKSFLFFLVMCLIIASCVEKDNSATTKKTAQDCIDQYGAGFFLNSSDECEWSQALTITINYNSYWKSNTVGNYYYRIQFIRDGTKTSGTGTLSSYWTSPNGTFSWQMSAQRDDAIQFSNLTNSPGTSMLTKIVPNAASYPTSFKADLTDKNGTFSYTFTMVSGSL